MSNHSEYIDFFKELKLDESDTIPLPSREEVKNVLRRGTSFAKLAVFLTKPDISTISMITPGIYLTGVGGLTRESFEEVKPTHIINVTKFVPKFIGYETVKYPIDDTRTDNIYPILIEGSDWINKQLEENPDARILVHCHAGASRSASVILAYFIRFRKMSLRTAFHMVSLKRPLVRPNSTFIAQLLSLEKEVIGRESGKMIFVEKNNRIIEMPSFRPYDQPDQFNREFESKFLKTNEVSLDEVAGKLVISLDREPEFFKETSHSVLCILLSRSSEEPSEVTKCEVGGNIIPQLKVHEGSTFA